MHDVDEKGALEMVRSMLRWAARGRLDWEVNPATLMLDPYGDVAWSVTPKVGGPIEITHRIFSLRNADLGDLTKIATALLDCGEVVERLSRDRVEFEQAMRKAARSLLRRKAAVGVRLVSVVSQFIPTDDYQDVGVVVTFAWETVGGETATAAYEIMDAEELKENLNMLLDWHENGPSQLAT